MQIHKFVIIILILCFVLGCAQNFNTHNTHYFSTSKYYQKERKLYNKKPFTTLQDTVLYKYGYVYHFENGKLTAIGKERDKRKKGIWFYYENDTSLTYVVHYKTQTTDTLYDPGILVNYKWSKRNKRLGFVK